MPAEFISDVLLTGNNNAWISFDFPCWGHSMKGRSFLSSLHFLLIEYVKCTAKYKDGNSVHLCTHDSALAKLNILPNVFRVFKK